MYITLIGNKSGVSIDHNNRAYVNYTTAINIDSVDLADVNHLVIHRDSDGQLKIIQANGYSCDRGLFCNLY